MSPNPGKGSSCWASLTARWQGCTIWIAVGWERKGFERIYCRALPVSWPFIGYFRDVVDYLGSQLLVFFCYEDIACILAACCRTLLRVWRSGWLPKILKNDSDLCCGPPWHVRGCSGMCQKQYALCFLDCTLSRDGYPQPYFCNHNSWCRSVPLNLGSEQQHFLRSLRSICQARLCGCTTCCKAGVAQISAFSLEHSWVEWKNGGVWPFETLTPCALRYCFSGYHEEAKSKGLVLVNACAQVGHVIFLGENSITPGRKTQAFKQFWVWLWRSVLLMTLIATFWRNTLGRLSLRQGTLWHLTRWVEGKFCARLKAFREYFFSRLVAVDCTYVWVVLQGFFFDGGDIVGHASNRIVGILIVSVEPSACPWKTKREKDENSFRFLVHEERWTIIPYVHYWIGCI